MDTEHEEQGSKPARARSPWDIRTVIAGLLGAYGVVLLLMGAFATTGDDLAKADGTNLNLWTGGGLVVAAALMGLWVMLRPIRVQDNDSSGDQAG